MNINIHTNQMGLIETADLFQFLSWTINAVQLEYRDNIPTLNIDNENVIREVIFCYHFEPNKGEWVEPVWGLVINSHTISISRRGISFPKFYEYITEKNGDYKIALDTYK